MARLLTFERLKWASFTHSAVYTALLVSIFTGPDGLTTVLGWSHGIGWIVMSLACITALRLRVIDLRLAVAVAVLGGVGPFVGSIEFARQSRRGRLGLLGAVHEQQH
jgi:multisubunit Na+/H+ antiporter MnhF subunit